MDKFKDFLIKLTIFFISLLITDGCKTVMLIDNNLQFHMIHAQCSDPEIPHQHNYNNTDVDEKWMNSDSFDLVCSYNNLFLFPDIVSILVGDFAGFVFQPPKSV